MPVPDNTTQNQGDQLVHEAVVKDVMRRVVASIPARVRPEASLNVNGRPVSGAPEDLRDVPDDPLGQRTGNAAGVDVLRGQAGCLEEAVERGAQPRVPASMLTMPPQLKRGGCADAGLNYAGPAPGGVRAEEVGAGASPRVSRAGLR